MTIALDRPVGTTDPATLVPDETMQRLTARIVKDHPDLDHVIAQRIVGQTAAFLAASGQRPGADLSPSKLVDTDPEAARLCTLTAITDAGYTIDHDLWPAAAKMNECSQCHAGCTDSPNGGKK
jgi:hypothetical protein